MKKMLWLLLLGTTITLCAHARPALAKRTLKDTFGGQLYVGVALSTDQVMGEDSAALELVRKQFNSITPENLLKWEKVHPESDVYNFEPADRFVEFGEANDMFIVGHTLVWNNQTPRWVFQRESSNQRWVFGEEGGNRVDRATLLERMREHIHTVVGRYKGRIHAWDVVNEAFQDDGSLRNTRWRRIIGDDYIEKAFEYAHEADPDAKLYYNDFSMWHPGRREAVKQLVQNLQEKGIPIHGIGMQGHWALDYPEIEEIETMFEDYSQLGISLMITEMDVNVLPSPFDYEGAEVRRFFEYRKELDPYRCCVPYKVQRALADRYAALWRVIYRYTPQMNRVTFWGVTDGDSWHNNWPVRGRTAHSLLFDRRYQPKRAFWSVLNEDQPK